MSVPFVISLIAAAVSLASCLPYIGYVLSGAGRPNRYTWCVLVLVNALVLSVAWHLKPHTFANLVFPLSYAVGSSIVLLAVLWVNKPSPEPFRWPSAIAVGVSLAIWKVSKDPALAFIGLLLANFLGIYPTLVSARRNNKAEGALAWRISFAGNLIQVVAVIMKPSLFDAILIAYMTVVSGILVWFTRAKQN